jgi:type VI secretion system protein ImpK
MNDAANFDIPAGSDHRPADRLINCFTETIGYTLYLVDGLTDPQPDFESVQAHYNTLLERSGKHAQEAKIPRSDWKKGCFPVCAWVDEKIMCSSWSEKAGWQQNQLQLKFFQTTMAGREFFARLESLKENDREIREVFTYCLALGYSGQYYADDNQLELSEIKVDNLLKYFSEDQEMNIPEELFPKAYQDRSGQGARPEFAGMFSSMSNKLIFLLPPLAVIGAYIVFFEKLRSLIG